MTLKIRIVSTSVRTAAWCQVQRKPSTMSCQTGRASSGLRPCAGQLQAGDQHDGQHATIAWVANGMNWPA